MPRRLLNDTLPTELRCLTRSLCGEMAVICLAEALLTTSRYPGIAKDEGTVATCPRCLVKAKEQ